MKLKYLLVFILLTAATAYGQEEAISWINENSYALKLDSSSTDDDLSFLSRELRGKTVVGLGEASHGTREFYLQKGRIIERLITKEDFKLLSFEFASSFIAPINQYLQSGQGDLKELMRPMALYNTEEIYRLFQWISEYNKNKSTKNKVVLTGFDNEDFWGNPLTRDKFMAENIIKSHELKKRKTIIWTHNVHIAKDTTMAKFPTMGLYLKKHFGKKFYAVGFDTYQGSVNVLNQSRFFEMHTFEGKQNTLSDIFAKAKYEAFYLSFTTKPSPFTGTTSFITNIFSNWQELTPLPIRPGVDFDGMVFIRNTSASVKLGQ